MVDLKWEVVDGDSSVRVAGSVHSKAEDIFDRLIREFDLECSEERIFFFESFLEPEIGDFLCSGMDLLVIISVEFMVKNPLGLFDFGDILSDAGSDESILEPAIGAFNLASGLRGKGMNDLHIAVLENLFPLRSSFILACGRQGSEDGVFSRRSPFPGRIGRCDGSRHSRSKGVHGGGLPFGGPGYGSSWSLS